MDVRKLIRQSAERLGNCAVLITSRSQGSPFLVQPTAAALMLQSSIVVWATGSVQATGVNIVP